MKVVFLSLIVFTISTLVSCDYSTEKEVNVGLNEAFVYFDDEINDYRVLRSGKHKYSTKYFTSLFSLGETEIKDLLQVRSKDDQTIELDIAYWYCIKEEGITKIHENYSPEVEARLILPSIRNAIRAEIMKWHSDSLSIDSLRSNMLNTINTSVNYSHLIESKSFIINELIIED